MTSGDSIARELSALRDLFQRRLLEDKARNRLYADLHEQVKFARADLVDQYLRPLMVRLLLIADRLQREGAEPWPEALSFASELEDLMNSYGVLRIPDKPMFDAAMHEAVKVIVANDLTSGTIVKIIRPGYRMHGSLLRPARVWVSRAMDGEPSDSSTL